METIAFEHGEGVRRGVIAVNTAHIQYAKYVVAGKSGSLSTLDLKVSGSEIKFNLRGEEADRVWGIINPPVTSATAF